MRPYRTTKKRIRFVNRKNPKK